MQTHTNEACMYVTHVVLAEGASRTPLRAKRVLGWALIRLSRVPGTGVVIIQDCLTTSSVHFFGRRRGRSRFRTRQSEKRGRNRMEKKEHGLTDGHTCTPCMGVYALSRGPTRIHTPAKKHALPTHNILHDTYTRNPGTQNRTHSNIGRSNSYVSL